MNFVNFLLLLLFNFSLTELYRTPLLYHPHLFTSFLQGGQHIVIAVGTEEGERLYAVDNGEKTFVKLRRPNMIKDPHPNEVWLLEPCECGANSIDTFRVKHVQSGKYLSASSAIHNTFYHGVTLIDDKDLKNTPELNDFKSYWMINVQGAFFRNIYYDEYLVRGEIQEGNPSRRFRSQKFSGDVLTGPKPTKESYWVTILKSRASLIKQGLTKGGRNATLTPIPSNRDSAEIDLEGDEFYENE